MTKTSYHVDYQVFGTIYLERDRPLSGTDLAQLWSGTEVFGSYKGIGNFWKEGTVPNAQKPISVELGSTQPFQALLDNPSCPIFGGVSCAQPTRRAVDCDLIFAHDQPSRSFGYDTLPLFMMGVSGQWFERTGTEIVLETFREQFEVADRYNPPYGFVDVAASEDCYSGYVYVSYWSKHARLHRWAEQIKFLNACSRRRDQARGIYWGNYFGPSILERLGGREQFVSRFRNHAMDGNKKPNALIWEFINGVFVSLCLDPLGCKPGPPLDGAAGHNLHWLLLELGSHGVLCPWSGEGAK